MCLNTSKAHGCLFAFFLNINAAGNRTRVLELTMEAWKHISCKAVAGETNIRLHTP